MLGLCILQQICKVQVLVAVSTQFNNCHSRITFSETPPVFSKPKNVPRRKLSKDEWESVWEEHFPDEEEKVLKNFFLKSASETCRAKLGEEFAKTRAEIDSLHSVNRDLIER